MLLRDESWGLTERWPGLHRRARLTRSPPLQALIPSPRGRQLLRGPLASGPLWLLSPIVSRDDGGWWEGTTVAGEGPWLGGSGTGGGRSTLTALMQTWARTMPQAQAALYSRSAVRAQGTRGRARGGAEPQNLLRGVLGTTDGKPGWGPKVPPSLDSVAVPRGIGEVAG